MKRWLSLFLLLVLIPQSVLGERKKVNSTFDKETLPESLELEKTDWSTIYRIKGTDRLIQKSRKSVSSAIKNRVKLWNEVLDGMNPRVPVYAYLVEDCNTQPAATSYTFSENSKLYTYLKKNFHVDAMDHLKFSTLEQYCSYYYTTDHHWNYRGSYQGYVDIVRMLLGEEEKVLEPSAIEELPVIFNGSRAQHAKFPISSQKFAFYVFDDYPDYSSYVNGKARRYGNRTKYMEGVYAKKTYTDHYSAFYGSNYGLIEFRSKEKNAKKNLLIIGDSFSNPVETMLTRHYKNVIFVDLRHYQGATNRRFSMKYVINKYKIDQVLFLGCFMLFSDAKFKELRP